MGKSRYKDAKQEDRLHQTLTAFWRAVEPYLLPVGIAAGAILLIATISLLVSRRRAASRERPWAQYYEAIRLPADGRAAEFENQEEALAALARDYRGEPVAALSQLRLAQWYFQQGLRAREGKDASADSHFERAAAAAEQVVADFPDYPRLDVAHFEAGKARLALGQHEPALDHFREASRSGVLHLAAQAQWQAGLCHEKLGNREEARRAFESARDNQAAGWVAQQADYHLARLDRAPPPKQE